MLSDQEILEIIKSNRKKEQDKKFKYRVYAYASGGVLYRCNPTGVSYLEREAGLFDYKEAVKRANQQNKYVWHTEKVEVL